MQTYDVIADVNLYFSLLGDFQKLLFSVFSVGEAIIPIYCQSYFNCPITHLGLVEAEQPTLTALILDVSGPTRFSVVSHLMHFCSKPQLSECLTSFSVFALLCDHLDGLQQCTVAGGARLMPRPTEPHCPALCPGTDKIQPDTLTRSW